MNGRLQARVLICLIGLLISLALAVVVWADMRRALRQATTAHYTPFSGEAEWEGNWELSELGADPSEAGTERVTIPFVGTEFALRVRRGNYRGYLFVSVDGEPAIRLYAQDPKGPVFMRVCGRIFAEPSHHLQQTVDDFFSEVVARFGAAFRRALPALDEEELAWRMHFTVGTMIHTLMEHDRLKRFTRGMCTMSDPDALIERMVTYCAAGMRAPRTSTGAELEPVLMETPL